MNEITLYLTALLKELENMNSVMAVTVTDSLGSAPRGAGARMLVGRNGRITGTVGGGPIEYEAQNEAARLLLKQTSACREYDLSEPSSGIGMVCGGRVKLAFHYIGPEREDVKSLCRTALPLLKAPGNLWLVLELPETSASSAHSAGTDRSVSRGRGAGREFMGIFGPDIPLPPKVPASVTDACRRGKPGTTVSDGREYYLEPIASDSLVHIFGGGHVARELVPLLSRVGFSCAVYDDREEFLRIEDFPDAFGTAVVSFDHLEESLYPAAGNYFVIMTRGHIFDLQAQACAMRSPSLYIGVMGSRKKKSVLTQKLLNMGFRTEELECVHAPIGLNIGASTPAEIAVSIAAELIAVRSGLNQTNITQEKKKQEENR